MNKSFGIICFLLFCLDCSAQLKSKKPLQVLLGDLQVSRQDTSRIYVLLQIANYYLERVPSKEHKADSALHYIDQADKLADLTRHELLKQEVVHCLAKYYLNTGNVARAKELMLALIEKQKERGDHTSELKWLDDLQDHLKFSDTTGITKLQVLKRMIAICDPVRHRKDRIRSELNIGEYYYQQLQLDSAEYFFMAALNRYHPVEPDLLLSSCHTLAEIYRYKGNMNKSLMYALESLKASEKGADNIRKDFVYGQLGLTYEDLGAVATSIGWYKKALELRMTVYREPATIYRTTGFLIQQLIKQSAYKEASAILNDVIAKVKPVTDFDSATFFQLTANYYNGVKKYDKAEEAYLKMITSGGIVGKDPEVAVIANEDIGNFYLHQKQYEKSKIYLTNAVNAPLTYMTVARLKDIHLKLYTLDSLTGNYLPALQHLRAYQQIHDSLFDVNKSRQIEELKIQYETEKIAQNNSILANESKLQHNQLAQAKQTRNWILGALFATFLFAGIIFYNFLAKQRNNKKLKLQGEEITEKNIALNHLITEKEWLIKEIHHRVKNNFHMVLGLLDTQAGYLKNEEALTAISESQHRVQAMAFIHQKLYQSSNLSSVEMPAYIHELVDYLRDSFVKAQHVIFKTDIARVSLNLSHALPLALILNEAITNAIKYAFPRNNTGTINISLKKNNGNQFELKIEDDGAGMPALFNYEDPDTMGMRLMQGLCDDIHGQLIIRNTEGCSIIITFVYDGRRTGQDPVIQTEVTKELSL